jgi:hypothetical protein
VNAGEQFVRGGVVLAGFMIGGFNPFWLLVPLVIGVIGMWVWPRRD